jgi:biopolymer transport protein ExbB
MFSQSRLRAIGAKVRVFCLLVLMAGALTAFATSAYGQAAPASGSGTATPEVKPQGLVNLIMGHIDGVFITIALLSIIGLTLIIQGAIKTRKEVMMPTETTEHIKELISQKQFKELIEYTESDPTFVSRALNPALKRAPSFASMKEAMETALGEQTAEAFRRIEYLNIIGNLGPLLGLLGTVLGMIEAFEAMHAAKGATDPSLLSFGIATALTHTFLGLMLAIPCLAAFGVLRTIVDRNTVSGALQAEELLLMIKPVEAKPAAAAPLRAAPLPAVPGAVRKIPVPMPPPAPAV